MHPAAVFPLQTLGASLIAIRPACLGDAAFIAEVHVRSWKSTYAGLLPADYLSTLTATDRKPMWEQILSQHNGRHNVFVACSGEAIIGFVSAGTRRGSDFGAFDAEIYALYLLQEYQRHGTGRLLFQAAVEQLLQDRHVAAMLWVLDGNPTIGFYERMKGTVIGRKKDDVAGCEVQEIAYGWTLKSLMPCASTHTGAGAR